MKKHSNLRLALAITLASSVSATVYAAGGGVAQADPGAMQGKHFDAKGKLPSPYTIELQKALRKLPRNLRGGEVTEVRRRLDALGNAASSMPIPLSAISNRSWCCALVSPWRCTRIPA